MFNLFINETPETLNSCSQLHFLKSYQKVSKKEILCTQQKITQDAQLSTPLLASKYGYRVEIHMVTTTDGYILQVHRINKRNSNAGRGVVFMMHGLFASSSIWVLMGPGDALAYILADLGYDVWLGNARGNKYSRKHTSIDASSKSFWNFSWHEIGNIDLPNMIDYILHVTSNQKLHYIGYSQGTTSFFVMSSINPEYNEKVQSMHALAPISYMSNLRSPFVHILTKYPVFWQILLAIIGNPEVLPNKQYAVTKYIDNLTWIVNFVTRLGSCDSTQLNLSKLPVIFGHLPAGSSEKQCAHYLQLVNSGTFCQYDYGLEQNNKIYGTQTPPTYKLKNISTPVHLYYSENDCLAAVVDIMKLKAELPNIAEFYRVPNDKYNHFDFIFGLNINNVLYNKVTSDLNKYK